MSLSPHAELIRLKDSSSRMNSRRLEVALILCVLLTQPVSAFAQGTKTSADPSTPHRTPRRLTFDEARALLVGEAEGNINSRPGAYSETKLRNGQILELYYPMGNQSSSKSRGGKPGVTGYGLLHESGTAYDEARRPRHILEELLPDGQGFVAQVPSLVGRLEKRLRLTKGALDYSRTSLRRLDAYVASYRRTHTTADTDAGLFQELTAYYGEVLKKELAGEWRTKNENIAQKRAQVVPNVAFQMHGASRELRPWSSILDVLYNEDQRTLTITAVFNADLKAARS